MSQQEDVLFVFQGIIGFGQLVFPPDAVPYYNQLQTFLPLLLFHHIEGAQEVGEILAFQDCANEDEVGVTVGEALAGGLLFVVSMGTVVAVGAVVDNVYFRGVDAVGTGNIVF